MKHSPTIQMTFECNQDWDAMKVTACGRYCDVCKKEVIDFTKKSPKEYKALFAGNTELCGQFNPEQLDLSLIRPITLSVHRKAFLVISTLFISLFSKPAAATSIHQKTEQLATDKNSPAPTIINTTIAAHAETELAAKIHYDKPIITTKKRRYYWSRRFPFIRAERVGSRAFRGNIRML